MTHLSITLLGAPRIERDGILLDIPIRKAVALLAYLAVTGQPHTRDALAALFWPEADQERARGALRYTLAQLKAAIGAAWLSITREQIGLRTDTNLLVDVAEVDRLLAQIQAHGHSLRQPCAVCLPLLQAIVARQQGALLSGFSLPDSPPFDDWLFFESERLHRVQADALASLIAFYRAADDPAAALPYAQRLVALDPLQEKVNELLIQLYLESEQPAAALRHYEGYAKLLRDEFDAAPDPATTALLARLTHAKPLLTQSTHPPSGGRSARELPHPTTALIGRAHELVAIGDLLDDPACRLLTLLGPGGSGKTRLALAVAHVRQSITPQAIVFIPLAGLTAPDALVATLAAAVGCPLENRRDPQQHLLDYLGQREQLLILDNFEHLLERTTEHSNTVVALLDTILATVPGIQLLVTSRVRLQLYQEQLYPVQGLDYPEWDTLLPAEAYGAVQLFVQRARRVRPAFNLTPATTPGVLQIVRLLAGQPLAIELAAAWIASLTPAEIATELSHGIDLLASEARNVPARHRSMRATYLFSWEQLQPQEQLIQQALAVFRGGFTREAAAQVAGATPRMLQALIDQSLLEGSGEGHEGMRYALHELLRQFAAEQLARDPARAIQMQVRHATFYLTWVTAQMAEGSGLQYLMALRAIETELGNVEAAWAWAVTQQDATLISAAMPSIGTFYHQRGRYQEGYAACVRAIAHLDVTPLGDIGVLALGQALAWQAAFAIELLQLGQARALLERSLSLLNTPATQQSCAFVYYWLGRLAFLESDLAQARRWLENSRILYQKYHDPVGTALTLSLLGRLAWLADEYAQASRWYEDSLALYRTLNDIMGRIHVMSDLAMVTVLLGQEPKSTQLFAEVHMLAQLLDDPLEIAQARRYIGRALLYVGHNRAAQLEYERCLTIATTYERYSLRVEDRLMLGFALLMQRHYDQVNAFAQETFDIARQLGSQRDAGFALMLLGLADLGQGAYERARERLQQCLAIYQVTNTADDQSFTLFGLSQAQRALGEYTLARRTALTALTLTAQSRSVRAGGMALAAFIGVLLDEQAIERAVELEALVMRHPSGANSPFYHQLLTEPVARHAAQLSPTVVTVARARGRARGLVATVDELLAESI